MIKTIYLKRFFKTNIRPALSAISCLSLILFLFCNKNSTSPDSISQRKLDCNTPTEISGSNGTVVEIFNTSGSCKLFKEYANEFSQTFYWDGHDNNGNPVESGWYTIKISVLKNGTGSVLCRDMYVDHETTPPDAPKNITAVPGDRKLILQWDAVPKAVNYFVYYDSGEKLGNTPDSMRVGMTNDTIITGLKNGSLYSVAIKARNAGGTSVSSDTIQIFLPVVIPTAPVELRVENRHKSISLSWSAVDGAAAYEAFCKKGTSISIKPGDSLIDSAQKIIVSSPPAVFTNLIDCEEYRVGVLARNSAGVSPLNSIAARPELSNPSVVWNQQTDTSVNIRWKNIDGAKVYRCIIQKALSGATDSLVFNTILPPLVLQGLTQNLPYYAKVYSIDSLNASCCSTIVYYSFTPLPQPTGFTATPKCRRVEFTWNKSGDISLYRVYFAKGNFISLTDSFVSFHDIDDKVIPGLNNGTMYTFAVAYAKPTASDTSVSPFSQSITVTPMPTPPDSLIIYTGDTLAIVNDKYAKYYDSVLVDSLAIYYSTGTVMDTLKKPFMTSKLPCTIPSLSPNTWYNFSAKSYVSGFSSVLSNPSQVFTAKIKNFALYDTVDGLTSL